jgi:lipopolysaccharide transport system ATP-binding protein
MKEVLIKAEGVSKKFAKDLKKSLFYGLSDVFGGVIGRKVKDQLRKDEFWAVQDVHFEVRRGECLGLIGHNGAGKSTLLKMLNGLIAPDKGSITMKGRIAALIELGAGFNPILTGRENIYNNAAVIGFSKKEIDARFDSIVAFSEIGEFIDTPVKNYSSGMKVRLGFAVAAQLEPDVLIIDEVLAVGDLGFRVKCINRIQELLRKSAVIFVSHSMAQVTTICTYLILLNKGRIEFKGTDIGAGVEKYFMKEILHK